MCLLFVHISILSLIGRRVSSVIVLAVDEIEIFKDTTVEYFGVDAQALFS